MLHLDGRTLEGGGQLLRNALALSALTGRPVKISRIRGRRAGAQGLRRSHTAAVQFLAEVCGGRIVGARVGSPEVTFYPRGIAEDEDEENLSLDGLQLHPLRMGSPIKSEYNIRLTTPGSIFLIFQALYPYLLYAGAGMDDEEGTSDGPRQNFIKLNITGGTNLSFSPSYDYVTQVLVPNFAKLGLPRLSVKLGHRGWSSGGVQIGSVSFEIEPLSTSSTVGETNDRSEQDKDDQGQTRYDGSGDEDKRSHQASSFAPPKFPHISLKNLDPGFITKVDITILAPDTLLEQATTSSRSRGDRHRTGRGGKEKRYGAKRSERQHHSQATLYDPELDEDDTGYLEAPIPDGGDIDGSPSRHTIRGFLEDATVKRVTRAMSHRQPSAASGQQVPPQSTSTAGNPAVNIHTTERTHGDSRIYILLVAHTSTGFRLGRDKQYADVHEPEVKNNKHNKNKKTGPAKPQESMKSLLERMVDTCVADLISEFPEDQLDGGAKGKSAPKTKGCLDTYMRDQVVVFQALGQLGAEETGEGHTPEETEEAGLSLHSQTAIWAPALPLKITMACNRSLHLSHSFVISCGTVTVDLIHKKLLLITWRTTGECFLPKGRKDIGETLEQTALRETFEETGHRVELLPLRIQTLATVPAILDSAEKHNKITEPVAVQQRVTKEGALKIIFWFAAKGNSAERQEKREVQQEGEDFDTMWVSFEDSLKTLSFDDDRQIAGEVLHHVQALLVEGETKEQSEDFDFHA
ncbi:hypothetical protein FQN52_001577 [Onygenales sp. PD_12]|nr:hypothetical protein FQN52_001577 [Onygenales sp. PD_12]